MSPSSRQRVGAVASSDATAPTHPRRGTGQSAQEPTTLNQRADARRNRAEIIAAAITVFQAAGVAAPLDDVATTAGVGRGTIYRHFPHRVDLVAAVYEQTLASDEAYAREHPDDPNLVLRLLDRITARQESMAGFLALIRAVPDGHTKVAELHDRIHSLLHQHLPRAQAEGLVPPGINVEDLLLVPAMMEGLLASLDPDQLPTARRRLLDLLQLSIRSDQSGHHHT